MSFGRNISISKKQLAEHWMMKPDWLDEFGYAGVDNGYYDDELVSDECWACGDAGSKIQRAHIESHCVGGPSDPDNIVLLCVGCHGESEHLSVDTFWNWLRHKRKSEWTPAIKHTEKRMDAAGFGWSNMAFFIDEMGPLEAVKFMCKKTHCGWVPEDKKEQWVESMVKGLFNYKWLLEDQKKWEIRK